MIANDRWTPMETAVAVITSPAWLPFYGLWKGCRMLGNRLVQAAKFDPQPETLVPRIQTPSSDLDRRVFVAMILAGRPVTNAELARLMGCSPGEASKRVRALEGVLKKERIGREVRIALPNCP